MARKIMTFVDTNNPSDASESSRSGSSGLSDKPKRPVGVHPDASSGEVRATLRRSGGSVILALPKTVTALMGVTADADVVLSLNGRVLEVRASSMSLAQRLAVSPKTPDDWYRDDSLGDELVGRELI